LNLAAIDVSRMLDACRPTDRLLLEAQMNGVTAQEIAREQGLPPGTIRIRFLRARRSARTVLGTLPIPGTCEAERTRNFSCSRA